MANAWGSAQRSERNVRESLWWWGQIGFHRHGPLRPAPPLRAFGRRLTWSCTEDVGVPVFPGGAASPAAAAAWRRSWRLESACAASRRANAGKWRGRGGKTQIL